MAADTAEAGQQTARRCSQGCGQVPEDPRPGTSGSPTSKGRRSQAAQGAQTQPPGLPGASALFGEDS